MEECPPGGDCASGEGDPSKSDNPPARWTPNPAGEQAQGKSVPTGDGVSQAASHSPQSKRKKGSSAPSASQVLKKHEEEFFDVVDPKLHVLRLKRKGVISGGLISKIETANTEDAKDILFEHLHHNADVAALREYCKIAKAADGFPKMQKLGEKMQNELALEGASQGSQQSVSQAGVSRGDDISQAASHSPELKRRKVSSTISEPITEQHEAVTGGTDKSPKKDYRSSTKEAATFSTKFYLSLLVLVGLVLISSIMLFLVLQLPSSDQKAVARYRVEEEARKGSKGETSVVPDQVTGGPTATTTGCQAQTQSAVPGQITGGPTAAARGSQPPTQVAVSPVIKAAKFGKVAAVRKLLDEGAATVEDRDENGSNALHIAAKFGHLELVKFLIPIFGEKKFAVNHSGDTCLTLAIQHQKEDVVEYLIQEGGFGRQH